MVYRGVVEPLKYSRTLKFVAVYAALVGLYSLLPLWKEYSVYRDYLDSPSAVQGAISLVLGWLLVFRTNIAYNRWWEARTLWGALVNACRNVAVKTATLSGVSDEDMQETHSLIVSFPPLLRDHLRGTVNVRAIPALTNVDTFLDHPPSEIVRRYYGLIEQWKRDGRIDVMEQRILDVDLQRLLDICGGCERIRNTPIVPSYRTFVRQCVFFFLAVFPWGISEDFGVWTVPLTIVTAYFMLGLETVAEHIEEPFGHDDDDLDLDRLCLVIDLSVTEVFRRSRPGALVPKRIGR